ncbi:MAG: threonine synthase [Pseudomonadota bacterium]
MFDGTYRSTRGGVAGLSFDDAVTAGLAPDGGLFVPEAWPQLDRSLLCDPSATFEETALAVATAFAPRYDREAMRSAVDAAYGRFSHPARVPLVQTGPADWVMELFHGPTLAFKDVAMQLLGRLFSNALERTGGRTTVVGATSGDTGGAAIEALAGRPGVEVVMLHPEGRISDVQRRLMTTVHAENIANVAINGSFDDCQQIVKALFADEAFREEVSLGAVNSINWARIMAQAAYYVQAAQRLGGSDPVHFAVPTGNFGDAFAGYVAGRLGANVGRIIIATNENDILDRALRDGVYEPGSAQATISPAMDIQVASNFERMLYEATGREAASVQAAMAALKVDRRFDIPPGALKRMRDHLVSCRVDTEETEEAMRTALAETGMLIDPHTAVGVAAARRARREVRLDGVVVTLATAHPAKFPDIVETATGEKPALPERYCDLFEREERVARLPASTGAVADFVRNRRAG